MYKNNNFWKTVFKVSGKETLKHYVPKIGKLWVNVIELVEQHLFHVHRMGDISLLTFITCSMPLKYVYHMSMLKATKWIIFPSRLKLNLRRN